MPSPSPLRTAALASPVRWLFLSLALVFLGLAILGAFLPVLPSVPFLLLAAWAAARSSPRLSAWLEGHPRFGRLIRDWRDGGVVSRRSKWEATTLMTLSAVIILITIRKPLVAGFALGSMACVLLWLWRRPEQKPGAGASS